MSAPDLPTPDIQNAQETAWIEVITKMEEVYSDLIQYEIELEEKNAALEEAQRFITSVLSAISDILVVCDQGGGIQQVNLAFLTLTGLPEADLIGRNLADFLAGEVEAGALCHWLQRGRGADREVRFHAAGGGVTEPVELSCSTRLDHRGLPVGVVLTGRPVGELRRAYEALKSAQARLVQQEKMASIGRLVAGVAHELNNPVSFVVGNLHAFGKYRVRLQTYLDAIHAGIPAAERERLRAELRIDAVMADLPALVDGTSEGAQRVAEIVKSLKRLSFSDGAPPEAVDLAELARKAAHWAAAGRRSPVQVAVEIVQPLPARGRPGPLHQVVVNLVENAIDAVAAVTAPAVVVRGRVEAETVVLEVADNGPGLAESDQNRVFDPFFTTKPVGQGTGLGLWISYGIVRDHGGTLEVANRPEGGARFTLTLPRG